MSRSSLRQHRLPLKSYWLSALSVCYERREFPLLNTNRGHLFLDRCEGSPSSSAGILHTIDPRSINVTYQCFHSAAAGGRSGHCASANQSASKCFPIRSNVSSFVFSQEARELRSSLTRTATLPDATTSSSTRSATGRRQSTRSLDTGPISCI